jgi:hypothetical protein
MDYHPISRWPEMPELPTLSAFHEPLEVASLEMKKRERYYDYDY